MKATTLSVAAFAHVTEEIRVQGQVHKRKERRENDLHRLYASNLQTAGKERLTWSNFELI